MRNIVDGVKSPIEQPNLDMETVSALGPASRHTIEPTKSTLRQKPPGAADPPAAGGSESNAKIGLKSRGHHQNPGSNFLNNKSEPLLMKSKKDRKKELIH